MAASYLPHLDGIRAIALAGVLLFHFDVHPFQGGYVGVDVFLTLSGYLITRNIGIALHSKSGFSIRSFYVRRFFRLYPTSLVCTFVSAVLAVSMFPSHLVLSTLKSSLASMAFVANVYFYLTTGYFDHGAHEKPLLHHWSLSLEEQYYLIWPPLLLTVVYCVPRLQRSILVGMLSFLTITSFTAAIAMSRGFPSFSFFMLPTRIFQFAIGGLYAVLHWPISKQNRSLEHNPDTRNTPFPTPSTLKSSESLQPSFASWFRSPSAMQTVYLLLEFASLISIAVIVASYALLPSGAPALHVTPVNLATLILIALPNTKISTVVLSNSLLTWVGRLSYSAYLVHWPIYVFMRYAAPALHLQQPSAVIYILATFAFALALHHGIEQPCRRPNLFYRFLALMLLGITIALCRQGIRELGFHGRLQPYRLTGFPASMKDKHYLLRGILSVTKQFPSRKHGFVNRVGAIRNGKRSKYVFFGDSFAAHLEHGLHFLGIQHNVWFQLHSMSGCPLWGKESYIRRKVPLQIIRHRCYMHIRQMWREIAGLPSGSTIMVSNLWSNEPFDEKLNVFKEIVSDMSDLMKIAGEHKLVIIGEPPGLSVHVKSSYFPCAVFWQLPIGRLLAGLSRSLSAGKINIRPDATSCMDVRKGLEPDERQAKQMMMKRKHLEALPHVGFIDVWSELCGEVNKNWSTGAVCKLPVYFEDKRLFNVGYTFDGIHYSSAGSYFVALNILKKYMFGKGSIV